MDIWGLPGYAFLRWCGCAWDVNFDAGYLRTIGKGRKERLVPVGDSALSLLREYLDVRGVSRIKGRAIPYFSPIAELR